MNAKEAKQLSFPDLLARMGHQPIKSNKNGKELWYHSPLSANDKTPSFHTSYIGGKWLFKDFSSGAGGTIIDFVIAHEQYPSNDIKSALAYLRGKFPGSLFEKGMANARQPTPQHLTFSFHQQLCPPALREDNDANTSVLCLLSDLPLKSGILLSYLENQRKIARQLAQRYLRLVRYKNLQNGKTYYAFGMRNRAGGFEIRAASDTYKFKSALPVRDISIFGVEQGNDSVMVFEGMLDFLSLLQMGGLESPPCDVIVMHSVNSYGKCLEFMLEKNYANVLTYLDNDKSGEKYTAKFKGDLQGKLKPQSTRFAPYKDVNDALVANFIL